MLTNKILKSKRGVAIENAILFIIVIFMLCALLSSITLIAHYQFKIDNTVLANDVDLDQIGEDFIAFLESGETNFDNFLRNNVYKDKETDYERIYTKKYAPGITGNLLTVAPQGDSDSVLLYMRAQVEAGKVTAVSRSYSEPGEDDILDTILEKALEHYSAEGKNTFAGFVCDGYQIQAYPQALVVRDSENDVLLYIRTEILDDGSTRISTVNYSGRTEEERAVDRIGEKFALCLDKDVSIDSLNPDDDGYTCTYDDAAGKFTVVKDSGGTTVLYIKVDDANNIITWRYSDPETPSDPET